jgi:hypothetical protein
MIPTAQKLHGPRSSAECCEEKFFLSGIETICWLSSPQATHYTDWAAPSPVMTVIFHSSLCHLVVYNRNKREQGIGDVTLLSNPRSHTILFLLYRVRFLNSFQLQYSCWGAGDGSKCWMATAAMNFWKNFNTKYDATHNTYEQLIDFALAHVLQNVYSCFI